jgi:hypothetical protein
MSAFVALNTRLLLIVTLLISPLAHLSPRTSLKTQAGDGILTLSNEHLTLTLHGDMAFTLDDRSGRHLLYPDATSFVSLMVDGIVYSQIDFQIDSRPIRIDDTTAQELFTTEAGLELTVEYHLAGPAVQITARVENADTDFHDIEVRVLLDTQVDENDGSPLWAGGEIFTYEHELQPPFTLAKGYDRIPNPNMITTLTFQSQPERVIFAHWPSAVDVEWFYSADPDQAFYTPGYLETPESDSAILVYYDLGRSGPGQTSSCSLAYGLGSPEGGTEEQSLILALQQLEQALLNRMDADLERLTQIHLTTYRVMLTDDTIPAVLESIVNGVDLGAAVINFAETLDPSAILMNAMGMALTMFLEKIDAETLEDVSNLIPELYQEPRMAVDDPGLEAHIESVVSEQMRHQERMDAIRAQFQVAIEELEAEGLPDGYPVDDVVSVIHQVRDRLNLSGRQEAILFWPDPSSQTLQFRLSGTLVEIDSMVEGLEGVENVAGSLSTAGFWTSAAGVGGSLVKVGLLISTGGGSGLAELLVAGVALTATGAGFAISGTGSAVEIASDRMHAYLALHASTVSGYELDLMEEITRQTLQAVNSAPSQAHLWTASGQVESISLPDIILVEGEGVSQTNGSIHIVNTGSQSQQVGVMGTLQGNVGGRRIPMTILGDAAGTLASEGQVATISFSYGGPDTAITGSSDVYTIDLWANVGFQPIHLNDDPDFVSELQIAIARQDAAAVLAKREVTVIDSGMLDEGEFSTAPLGIGTVTSVTTLDLSYLGSDFDLHLYDSDGRHVGVDYQTGQVDQEIPGVTYSGSDVLPEWMRIEGYAGETLRTEVIAVSADAPEAFTLTSVQLPPMPALLGASPVILTISEPPAGELTFELLIYEYGGEVGVEDINFSIQAPETNGSQIEPLTTISVQAPETVAAGERAVGQLAIPAGSLSGPGDYGADLLLEGRDSSSGESRTVLVPIRLTIGEMDNILGGAISAPGSSTSQPGGGGLGIVLVALVAVGAATWIVVLNRGKTDQAGVGLTKATLIGAGGERIPLHKTNVMIGRGSSSDIRLSGNAVSRQHARLRFAQGDWYLQDQNSAGGTFVNGVRQAACKLRSGDQIMIGGQTFQFIIGSS